MEQLYRAFRRLFVFCEGTHLAFHTKGTLLNSGRCDKRLERQIRCVN